MEQQKRQMQHLIDEQSKHLGDEDSDEIPLINLGDRR
jgi:hypothetical protein